MTTTTRTITDDSQKLSDITVAVTPSDFGEQERERLVTSHLNLVRKVSARFRNSGEPMEDLVQVGNVGLLKAAAKFDPEMGNSFAAYAIPVIIGEIKNYFRDHGWAVRIPRKLQSRRLAVGRSTDILTQQLGRPPVVKEIAEATGFTEDEIYQSFEVEVYGKPASLDTEYDSSGSDDASTILDYVGKADPELETLPDRLDLARALSYLDEREKSIIYLYYFKGLAQTEIAKRLALSQMHVSRLQRSALGKLEEVLTEKSG